MALRLAFKIHSSNLVQNCGKFFYTRKATEPALTVQNRNETSKIQTITKENVGMRPQVYPAISNLIRRTNVNESGRHDTEAKILQHKTSQQLQPGMLPKYYQSAINGEAEIFPTAPERSDYRQFEKSLTYKNVKLPLKKPKLANPFPDPVKVIQSDIVSDQEKAEQMQATARLPSTKSVQTPGSTQYRHYSTKTKSKDGDDQCAKVPETQCEKHNVNCPPRARTYCKPAPLRNMVTEDIIYDTFLTKPSSSGYALQKQLELGKSKKSKGYTKRSRKKQYKKGPQLKVKAKKNGKMLKQNAKSKKPRNKPKKEQLDNTSWTTEDADSLYHFVPFNGITITRVPKEKCRTKNKNTQFLKKKELSKIIKKLRNGSSRTIIDSNGPRVALQDRLTVRNFPSLLKESGEMMLSESSDSGKVKKLPFSCPKKKEKEKSKKCPKHPKRKIKDCPPDRCGKGPVCSSRPQLQHLLNGTKIEHYSPVFYSTSGKSDEILCKGKKKKKGHHDDECEPCYKKEDSTRNCPKDLLKKKRRPCKPTPKK